MTKKKWLGLAGLLCSLVQWVREALVYRMDKTGQCSLGRKEGFIKINVL